MDRRYPSHYRSRGNLEPNISEIVNRTRRSMSLISQRYSSGGMDPPPYEQTTYSSTTPADCRNEDVLGNDVHLRVNKSTPPSRPDDNQQLVSNETKQSATDDILSRLSIIEMKLETKNENEDRLKEVESSLLHLKSVVDILTKELKDTRLGLDGLSSQSTNHQSLIEVLQRDIDSRRSTVSKFSTWMKQNEKWRTDIARQIADITADNKTMNEMLVETKRTLSDQVTRADLESLRDRLNISTEQNVTAALGIWHDKVELAVKQLEQRVAAIKVNNIVPNQTMRDSLEDAEVKKYFEALLPSEHLLKGAAFTAVRSMETDIQHKIELQMLASLRSHIRDAREEIRADMTQYLRRLNEHDSQYTQPENGSEIYSFGSDTALAIARYNMGVTEKDRLLKIMFDRIAELSSVVSSIQESLDVKAKTTAIEYQMLERKLNECLNLSAVHMSTIKTRTTELEIHVQDEEKKHHIRHCRFESEVCNKLSEIERVSGVKCEEIATRIASLKEVVDSVVERVNTSKRAFDEHFSASPEIKRLQSNAGKLDGLVMQFTSLRSNVRELESSVSKIQNTTVKSNEMAELKGRICRVEPLIGQVDDLLVAQQKIENNVFNSKDQLLSVTACIDELKAADVKILDRVGKAESTICTSARETRGFNELFERKLMSKIAMVEKTFGEENSSICKNVEDINTILSNTSSNLTSYISSVNQMQEKIEYLARTSSQHRDMMSNVEIRFAQSQQELSRSINSQISALRVQMDRERSEIANLQKIISDINKETQNIETILYQHENNAAHPKAVRSAQLPEIDKGGSSTCIVPEEYNAHDRLDGETSGVSTPVKPSSSSTPVNNAGDTVINLDSSFEDSMEAAPSFPLTTHSTNEDVDRSIAVASPIPSVPSVSEDMKVSVGSSGQQEDNIVSASGHIDGSVDDSTSVHEPEDVRHTSFDVDGSRSSNSDTDSSSSESSSVESTPVTSV